MKDVNLALIAKLGWKIFSNFDSLWVRQLSAKYIKYGNFFSSPIAPSASWLWKGIQKSKPLLLSGACLQVAKTSSLPMWTSAWIPIMKDFKPVPRFPCNRIQPSLCISDLLQQSSLQWNLSTISAIFDQATVAEILKIKISLNPIPQYLWTPSCSGKFTSHSAYLFIINARSLLVSIQLDWMSFLPPNNSLNHCPLCKSALDSLQHLFFNCIFARVVGRNSFWPLDSSALNFSNMVDWINVILSPSISLAIPPADHHKFQIFTSVPCDLLWFYRNKAYHEGKIVDARSISTHINKITLEHFHAWNITSSLTKEIWTPPSVTWFKINFVTAIKDSFSVQAVVCRDSNGTIIRILSQISLACLSNYGEALAAQLAVSLASSLHIGKFIIEGDSQVVILALQQPALSLDRWISSIISDTIDSIPAFSFGEVRKVTRNANF
ncbi:uncharacterized protein LOC132162261 [Corylus avellana]|uniref:uncharacterized protein LOC132162261 n=1 Tax=Corylus avellana TaxID=13451 RepID=UPI00286BFA3D|nr:uncharacterized protein LOC132162261 [Corylus avellana]